MWVCVRHGDNMEGDGMEEGRSIRNIICNVSMSEIIRNNAGGGCRVGEMDQSICGQKSQVWGK